MKAAKAQFEEKPLKELSKLAEEVLGEGYAIHSSPSDTGTIVFLDSLATGESKVVIDDPDCLEMLWVMLIEKRRLERKRAKE